MRVESEAAFRNRLAMAIHDAACDGREQDCAWFEDPTPCDVANQIPFADAVLPLVQDKLAEQRIAIANYIGAMQFTPGTGHHADDVRDSIAAMVASNDLVRDFGEDEEPTS